MTVPVIEPSRNLLYGQNLQPRRGKLQCKWNSVQPAADLRNLASVVFGQGEIRPNRLRSLDEELDRLRAGDSLSLAIRGGKR